MAVRFSSKAVDPVIPNIEGCWSKSLNLDRFDAKFVSINIKKDKTTKVYVCGPPAMNQSVPLGLK